MSEERAVVSTTGASAPSMFEFGGNIDRAWKFADILAKSQIIPDTFQGNTASVLIALDMANRMRRNPLEVMQAMYIVHGKPSFSSSFLISLINACGYYEPLRFKFTGEGEGKSCMAWTVDKRTGETVEGPEVSIKMAQAEGWYNKNGSKWKTMPDVMLRYRAASFFSRAYCPDLTGGFHSQEEIQDSGGEAVHVDKGTSVQELQAELMDAPRQPAAEVQAPKAQDIQHDTEVTEGSEVLTPQQSAKNGGAVTELEKLREEVKAIMGEEGLGFTEGEQAEFFFVNAQETELKKLNKTALAKVLREARRELSKRDAEAEGASMRDGGFEGLPGLSD